MKETLGVGIIGASAERGWASVSHVPAVKALEGLELVAVASGDQQKAAAAAKAFGASAGYASGEELIRDPNVKIVTIAVKVPDHRQLFLAAAAARKHIYCEWPLGKNLAETEELAASAKIAGIHVAIGLQTRVNPAAQQARRLITSGVIGRVLSARVLSTTGAFGKTVEPSMVFAEKAENGVTLLTIQGAHTFDLTIATLGKFAALNALATTQFPRVELGNPAKTVDRSIPDHVLVQGRMHDGSALAVEVAGGRPDEEVTFQFEVVGEKGVLRLEGGALRGFQSGRLTLLLNGQRQFVEESGLTKLPDEAMNVAGVYASLRDDISTGATTAPDCDHAVRLARLIGDVLASSETGARRQESEWPNP